MRLLAAVLSVILLAGTAPATASALTETRPLEVTAKFASALDPDIGTVTPLQKTGADSVRAESPAEFTTPLVKAKAPLPKPVVKPTVRTVRTASGSTSTKVSSTSTTTAAKPASSGSTLSQARSILASRIAMYPILRGATVEVGDTKGNPQAICYYKSGRIVINANHTASLERIINHEIWHIIDWRDNGAINWGESVPPSNAADYRG